MWLVGRVGQGTDSAGLWRPCKESGCYYECDGKSPRCFEQKSLMEEFKWCEGEGEQGKILVLCLVREDSELAEDDSKIGGKKPGMWGNFSSAANKIFYQLRD